MQTCTHPNLQAVQVCTHLSLRATQVCSHLSLQTVRACNLLKSAGWQTQMSEKSRNVLSGKCANDSFRQMQHCTDLHSSKSTDRAGLHLPKSETSGSSLPSQGNSLSSSACHSMSSSRAMLQPPFQVLSTELRVS
jgi:hypothetical protein